MATSRLIQAGLAALDYVVKKNEGCVCSMSNIDRYKNYRGITYVVSIDTKSQFSGNKYSALVYVRRTNQKWYVVDMDEFVEIIDEE